MSKHANVEEFESDGKPFKIPDFQPVSRLDNPEKLLRQKDAIRRAALKQDEAIIVDRDKKLIARRATGNIAPPLTLELQQQIAEDAVDSSALPDSLFNAGYVRGNALKFVEDSKKVAEKGAQFDRIDRVIRTEEEMLQIRNQFMILRGQSLILPWWDPKMFPPDGTCVLFGRRRAGKSWLMRFLLNQYKHIYRCVICLTNTDQNQFWAQYIPFRMIHKYDPFVVARIIKHQRAIMCKNALNADHPEKLINPYICVILDDVVANNMHHDPTLNALFYEGRHSKIAVFIATQHPKALPPGVRANADVAAIFPQFSTADQDTIREQYCNFFESKDDFNYALQQYTHDQHCMIIFLGDPSIIQINGLYHFKSDDPGPFVTSSREHWEGDDEYRRNYLERESQCVDEDGSDCTPIDESNHWLYGNDADGMNSLVNSFFGMSF